MLSEITPLVLTYNEAPNIERTLRRLVWASQILVVDSFSSDNTLELVRQFPQTRILQRNFDSFAKQCNFGLDHIQTPWVLSLDADYVLSEQLVRELKSLPLSGATTGYAARFRFCIHGHPLRASLYPPRTILYLRERARYRDEGHGHRVQVDGLVKPLKSCVYHDDRKPLERWLSEQNRYALAEACHLANTPASQLNRPDRIRRKVLLAPMLVFLYTLLGQRLILDGWPGWYYVFQRTLAEILLSLRLLESRLSQRAKH